MMTVRSEIELGGVGSWEKFVTINISEYNFKNN